MTFYSRERLVDPAILDRVLESRADATEWSGGRGPLDDTELRRLTSKYVLGAVEGQIVISAADTLLTDPDEIAAHLAVDLLPVLTDHLARIIRQSQSELSRSAILTAHRQHVAAKRRAAKIAAQRRAKQIAAAQRRASELAAEQRPVSRKVQS